MPQHRWSCLMTEYSIVSLSKMGFLHGVLASLPHCMFSVCFNSSFERCSRHTSQWKVFPSWPSHQTQIGKFSSAHFWYYNWHVWKMNCNMKLSSAAPTEADKILNRLLIELLRLWSRKSKHVTLFIPWRSIGSVRLSRGKDSERSRCGIHAWTRGKALAADSFC